MSLRLAVSGATGRMGKRILEMASKNSAYLLQPALVRKGSNYEGEKLSKFFADFSTTNGDPIFTSNINLALDKADVLIDFSKPDGTIAYLEYAKKNNVGMVIGTTGFSEDQKKIIANQSKNIPILFSSNMSRGMNLLFSLVEIAAEKLGLSFNVEITEAHHNKKEDAPSGSALTLGESVVSGWKKNNVINENLNLKNISVFNRHDKNGARTKDEIGFHSVRGGNIIGDHTVLYAGPFERLELTHKADSRDVFAGGALFAAAYVSMMKKNQKTGIFTMQDVIHEKSILG